MDGHLLPACHSTIIPFPPSGVSWVHGTAYRQNFLSRLFGRWFVRKIWSEPTPSPCAVQIAQWVYVHDPDNDITHLELLTLPPPGTIVFSVNIKTDLVSSFSGSSPPPPVDMDFCEGCAGSDSASSRHKQFPVGRPAKRTMIL